MNCTETRSRLQAFVDGELEEATTQQMADHLRTCDGCGSDYEECRLVADSLRAALTAEDRAPAGLATVVASRLAANPPSGRGRSDSSTPRLLDSSPLRRLFAMRSFRIAVSAATVVAVGFIAVWLLAGQDLAFARAIDKALQGVKSAHFAAVEGDRTVEVWATPDAERVTSAEGWLVAKDGRAYLFNRRTKRVRVTSGAVAHLKLLRSLNALLLSERLRGRALGKPTVEKETVTLPDGRRTIRIRATAKARHEGVVCTFSGTMFVDPATDLIMKAEATESVPNTAEAKRLVREGKLRNLHIRVDSVEYNQPVPAATFDTEPPAGWMVVGH